MHTEFNKSPFMNVQITAYTQFMPLRVSQILTYKPKALQKASTSKTDITVNTKMFSDRIMFSLSTFSIQVF